MATLAKHYKFRLDQPFGKLPKAAQKVILYGSGERRDQVLLRRRKGRVPLALLVRGPRADDRAALPGDREPGAARGARGLHVGRALPGRAGGRRLKPEALAVRVGGPAIDEVSSETIARRRSRFSRASSSSPREREIAGKILKEIQDRLRLPRQRRHRLPEPLAAARRRSPAASRSASAWPRRSARS